MAIAPINYATIQRTADIETFKNQQDTKPVSYTHLTLPTNSRV